MRAISLWQPWASLWLSPRKIHETRHWPLKIHSAATGVWLAVHAAKKVVGEIDDVLRQITVAEFGPNWNADLPRGAIIGRALVTACVDTGELRLGSAMPFGDDLACGNFDYGRYAWRRSIYSRLITPLPYRGQQGLFSVADEIFNPTSEVRFE